MQTSVGRILWSLLQALWHWGEARQTPRDEGPTWRIWATWQGSLGLPDPNLGPVACVMGQLHSGRRTQARRFAACAIRAGETVFWLGPVPPEGLGAAPLYFGRAPQAAVAQTMLETIGQYRAARVVVWELSHDVTPQRLESMWPVLLGVAESYGGSLLLVAPAFGTTHETRGPRWFVTAQPWLWPWTPQSPN